MFGGGGDDDADDVDMCVYVHEGASERESRGVGQRIHRGSTIALFHEEDALNICLPGHALRTELRNRGVHAGITMPHVH